MVFNFSVNAQKIRTAHSYTEFSAQICKDFRRSAGMVSLCSTQPILHKGVKFSIRHFSADKWL